MYKLLKIKHLSVRSALPLAKARRTTYININRKPDGTLYPTFNRPQFNAQLTFVEFCRRAAEELIQVASGFATGLGEEKWMEQ
ncbi:hypothetical protein [Prevotella sp.]|uniref:hypothetical protein n=1 Tax=Prevotella sp. TaxID=59823 RepID=UPI00307B46CF